MHTSEDANKSVATYRHLRARDVLGAFVLLALGWALAASAAFARVKSIAGGKWSKFFAVSLPATTCLLLAINLRP